MWEVMPEKQCVFDAIASTAQHRLFAVVNTVHFVGRFEMSTACIKSKPGDAPAVALILIDC
jgi:hypothetical protein